MGAWNKYHATFGVLGKKGFCLFVRLQEDTGDQNEKPSDDPFALCLRSYGEDDGIARELVEQINQWDNIGQPTGSGLKIAAYPIGVTLPTLSSQRIIVKKNTQFLLDLKKY